MNNKEENIDKIVREKLFDYEENPSLFFWIRFSLGNWFRRNKIVAPLLLFLFVIVLLPLFNVNSSEDAEFSINENIIKEVPVNIQIDKSTFKKAIDSNNTDNTYKSDNNEIQANNHKISNTTEPTIFKEVDQVYYHQMFNITEIDKNEIKDISIGSVSNVTERKVNTNSFNRILPARKNKYSISFEIGVYNSPLIRNINAENSDNYFSAITTPLSKNIYYTVIMGYQIKSINISLGIGIKNVNQNFKYNYDETIIDPNGGYYNVDTLFVNVIDQELNVSREVIGYDFTWVDEYMDVNYCDGFSNRLKYIMVPIKVSYDFNYGKFGLSPDVGLSINILTEYSGYKPTLSASGFVLNKLNNGNINNVAVSSELGISFLYQASSNYSFYMRPGFNIVIKPYYSNYPIRSRDFLYSLGFGIMYSF